MKNFRFLQNLNIDEKRRLKNYFYGKLATFNNLERSKVSLAP